MTPPPAPRNDLVQVFLTGVPGLNQPAAGAPSEVMRLNTSIAPVRGRGTEPSRRHRWRHRRLPERPPSRRRRGGHFAARGRRDPALADARDVPGADRWRVHECHHRLRPAGEHQRRPELPPVPGHVPVPEHAVVAVAQADPSVSGRLLMLDRMSVQHLFSGRTSEIAMINTCRHRNDAPSSHDAALSSRLLLAHRCFRACARPVDRALCLSRRGAAR